MTFAEARAYAVRTYCGQRIGVGASHEVFESSRSADMVVRVPLHESPKDVAYVRLQFQTAVHKLVPQIALKPQNVQFISYTAGNG